jgi:DNA-directed RNA polymerase subunit RPC12/RpoP
VIRDAEGLNFSMKQFDDLQASYLYCNKCGQSMPVKERLLLILPDGYLFEYFCLGCGQTVGDKKTKLGEKDRGFFR